MNVEQQSANSLEMNVTVTVSKEDYQAELKKQLKENRSKASLKGFRKGKAPESIIRKMYGKQILSDVVINKLQSGLYDYLKENDIQYLGNPIVAADQKPLDVEFSVEEYSLSFDLGLIPEFGIDTIESDIKVDHNSVEFSEDDINKGLMHLQKKLGNRIEICDDIQVDDMLVVKAFELEDGKIKDGGWGTDFLVLVSQISDEAVKKKLLKSKLGIEFDFDVYQLEAVEKAWAEKHLLHKDPDDANEIGNMFRGTVKRVERLVPAELNQELFDQAFGKDKVTSLDEVKEKVKEELGGQTAQLSENILIYKLRNAILDHYTFELPEAFLKRWLKEQRNAEELTDESYKGFEKGMKWTLIRNKLAEKYEIAISEEDVISSVKDGIRSYFAQYQQYQDDDRLNEMAMNIIKDQDSFNREYDKLLNLRIIQSLKENLSFNEVKMSQKELQEEYDEISKAMNAS